MIEILDFDSNADLDSYLKGLHSICNTSPYNTTDFFKLFSSGLDGLFCLKGVINGEIILLPGYLIKVPGKGTYTDFMSPYGYSGPIYDAEKGNKDLEPFWTEVKEWFISNKVISAFIRFSLNGNHKYFPGDLKETMLNIKGVIIDSEEEQWMNYEHKVRKNVNKALRADLVFEVVEGNKINQDQLISFHNIYISTMERTNATENFFFSAEAFAEFAKLNGDKCAFAFVREGETVTSTEMVLLSNDTAYSFLGGTLNDYFTNRPNDFLKHCLINYFRRIGLKYFVLGGGYGAEDGIFKYKKSFFPNDIVSYYTGRWIISPDVYDSVLRNARAIYIEKHGLSEELESKDFFPEYRKYKL